MALGGDGAIVGFDYKSAPAKVRKAHRDDPREIRKRQIETAFSLMDIGGRLHLADHVDQLTQDEMWRLLKEVAEVLCLILELDAKTALKKELISSMRATGRRASIRQPRGTSRVHP